MSSFVVGPPPQSFSQSTRHFPNSYSKHIIHTYVWRPPSGMEPVDVAKESPVIMIMEMSTCLDLM